MTEKDAPTQPARRGMTEFLRAHPRALAIGGGVVAAALLATLAVSSGAAVAAGAEPVTLPVVTVEPAAVARPIAATAPTATKVRTCSVVQQASDPRLAQMQAQVRNATTGEVLFDRGGTTASRPASVMKVLTSAAALSVLGPDYRAATTVVKGSEPGSVVLVGGGDVTLSRLPSGQESAYAGAAHLDELAAQVRAAWAADPANPPLTKLILDSSYFGGADWQPSWDTGELGYGSMPHMTALQVDGDRENPARNVSSRGSDPVGRAGTAFASALGGIATIERGTAPSGAATLGQVFSQPVSTLVQQTLIVSDNTIAEMLARLTAIQSGTGNTFEAIQPAVLSGLASYGIDTAGIRIVDGSGLSPDNAVPPAYLTELMRKVDAREGALGALFDGLPVAGQTGSLSYSDRFVDQAAVAAGSVFAKTGWITTGYTLSGIIHAADGTPLTFAIYALGDVDETAKRAIDILAAAFYSCGDNLSNS